MPVLPVFLFVGVLLAASTASAEVYRVKVKFVWLTGTGAPQNAPTPADQFYFADCLQSPRGHDAAWVERNCRRVAGAYFNPKEITVTQSVPWKK